MRERERERVVTQSPERKERMLVCKSIGEKGGSGWVCACILVCACVCVCVCVYVCVCV